MLPNRDPLRQIQITLADLNSSSYVNMQLQDSDLYFGISELDTRL